MNKRFKTFYFLRIYWLHTLVDKVALGSRRDLLSGSFFPCIYWLHTLADKASKYAKAIRIESEDATYRAFCMKHLPTLIRGREAGNILPARFLVDETHNH